MLERLIAKTCTSQAKRRQASNKILCDLSRTQARWTWVDTITIDVVRQCNTCNISACATDKDNAITISTAMAYITVFCMPGDAGSHPRCLYLAMSCLAWHLPVAHHIVGMLCTTKEMILSIISSLGVTLPKLSLWKSVNCLRHEFGPISISEK